MTLRHLNASSPRARRKAAAPHLRSCFMALSIDIIIYLRRWSLKRPACSDCADVDPIALSRANRQWRGPKHFRRAA